MALHVATVFASAMRKDQQANGDCCLRGLMLDGRHKSLQAMASRLPDGTEQNLQQFVNQSTWNPVPVRDRVRVRLELRRMILHDHETSFLRSSGSSASCVQHRGQGPFNLPAIWLDLVVTRPPDYARHQ
jgi:hypothetical protein